jgi:hypothetical protein
MSRREETAGKKSKSEDSGGKRRDLRPPVNRAI